MHNAYLFYGFLNIRTDVGILIYQSIIHDTLVRSLLSNKTDVTLPAWFILGAEVIKHKLLTICHQHVT